MVEGPLPHAAYGQAIATRVLCELCEVSETPIIRTAAQRAVNYVHKSRNPYSAWRYRVPPNGENDTSVTAWMVAALKAAQAADLKVDPEAFRGAANWLDEVTDPANGRVGYDALGTTSSRVRIR